MKSTQSQCLRATCSRWPPSSTPALRRLTRSNKGSSTPGVQQELLAEGLFPKLFKGFPGLWG